MTSDDVSLSQPSVPPTLIEVARAAGVSRSTASRALNGEPRVSRDTVEQVRRAAEALGYTPNPAARSLVTRRTGTIALVVPETSSMLFSDPYFATLLGGVTAGLSGSGLQLILFIAQEHGDLDRTLAYLRGGHVDGAMVVSHHRGDRLPEALASVDIPVVFDGRPVIDTSTDRPSPPYVDADNVGGGELAAEHLIARGRRRLGTVAGPADMAPGIDRLAGWTAALAAHGVDTSAVTHGDFTASGGASATGELLDRYPDLDGIFVASDLMATGALQELSARGVRVPDDVALVGFDDLIFSATTTPPLTTVRQPTREAGQRLAEVLVRLLDNTPPTDGAQVLPTELIVRAST